MTQGSAMDTVCAILSDCTSQRINDGHNLQDDTAGLTAQNPGQALGRILSAAVENGSGPVVAVKSSGPKPS
jgi:hypothetical protein